MKFSQGVPFSLLQQSQKFYPFILDVARFWGVKMKGVFCDICLAKLFNNHQLLISARYLYHSKSHFTLDANSSQWSASSKEALLFWFFSDFRCGVPLFIVIFFIYKNKYKQMLTVRLAGDHLYGK